MTAAPATASAAAQGFVHHTDPLTREAGIDQNRAWIRWLVTVVVSGFLFAYVSAPIATAWLLITLGLESASAWTRARLLSGDHSVGNWHVAAILGVTLAWIVHALLLWSQEDELARIAALIDLFTVALYGAIGGHKDKRILAALSAPPLIVLAAILIHFSWTTAPPAVAVVATLATLGACVTIAGNGWALYKTDRLLVTAHADLAAERDALDRRVQERTQALRQALAELEAASRAKSDFLNTMSHELRTPLTGILGYAEILREDIEAGAADVQDADRIVASGRRLLAMLNNVLDMASIEAGHTTVHLEPTDVARLIESIAQSCSAAGAQSGNRIVVDVDQAARAARTDANLLGQAVLHVVDNACKFTRDGEIRIHVTRTQVGAGSRIVIAVADTGVGMSAEALARVFEAFEQASQGKARSHDGAGLGLAITQRLMGLLGGDVTAESKPGRGTTVRLSLPG